jgi:hypothetical protein
MLPNLANPTQKPYVLGEFFQNFKAFMIESSLKKRFVLHFDKIPPKENSHLVSMVTFQKYIFDI